MVGNLGTHTQTMKRSIMKHERSDYNRIQDPEHKIPEDEPVFVLRAQDMLAPDTIDNWCNYADEAGADPAIIEAAIHQADAMRVWQICHGSKLPDLPTD